MIKRRQINEIPYCAQQMFDLVADVERYPEFVPFCIGLRVLERSRNDREEILFAEMLVKYTVLRERFKCKVHLAPDQQQITVNYVEGPFHQLDNVWQFRDLEGGGSEIDFEIAFEFKRFFLQRVSNTMFDQAFMYMSDAFVNRAHQIYRPTG